MPMKPTKKRKRADHSGSTFNSFLEQGGIREQVEAVAVKRVRAWQLEKALQRRRERDEQAIQRGARCEGGRVLSNHGRSAGIRRASSGMVSIGTLWTPTDKEPKKISVSVIRVTRWW